MCTSDSSTENLPSFPECHLCYNLLSMFCLRMGSVRLDRSCNSRRLESPQIMLGLYTVFIHWCIFWNKFQMCYLLNHNKFHLWRDHFYLHNIVNFGQGKLLCSRLASLPMVVVFPTPPFWLAKAITCVLVEFCIFPSPGSGNLQLPILSNSYSFSMPRSLKITPDGSDRL